MKDLKQMSSVLLDLSYEVEDAIEQEDNDRIGENLDSMLEIISIMIDIVEKED